MPVQVLTFCAPEDAALAAELDMHMRPLVARGLITLQRSDAAAPEDPLAQVRAADVVLVLLTPRLLQCPLWDGAALREAGALRESGELRAIPLLLEPCDYRDSWLASLMALPRGGRALSSQRDRGAAWFDIARDIRSVCENATPRPAV